MTTNDVTYRLLVIANETCPCPALLDVVAGQAGAHADHDVLIVAPALNSRVRHYLSDTDAAVERARSRMGEALEYLVGRGISARGVIGDADPFNALTDEIDSFDADEVLVSTHPPEQSHWLESRLVERVRERVDVPVQHVVSAYGVAVA